MATFDEVKKNYFSKTGAPWVRFVKSQEEANTLQFTKTGATWWGYGISTPIELGHIKAVNQVDWAKVKKFNGVSQANVKTIINVEG